MPEIEANTWWTSLKLPAKQVIELYHQHGTSEQFHSEIKSDMDLERLPSGKFATNALVLSLGLVAYNVLRLCGQTSPGAERPVAQAKRMPIRKPVARRRLRSVIQDLMYLAARWTNHSHRRGLSFWRNNPWHGIWERLYQRFTRRACPATQIVGKENDATVRLEWREVLGIPCLDGDPNAAVTKIQATGDSDVRHSCRDCHAQFA